MTQSFKHTVWHDYLLQCIIKAKTESVISHPQRDGKGKNRELEWEKRGRFKKQKRTRRRSSDLIALDDAILRLDRGRLPLHLQLGGWHRVDLDILRGHGGSWESTRGNNINTLPTITTHSNTGSIQSSSTSTHIDTYLLQKAHLHTLNANADSAAP